MMDPRRELEWSERPAGEYRAERLEGERERLERRLVWAMRKQDVHAIQKLRQRIEALDDAIVDDLTPGCPPNRFERYRAHGGDVR
ncbi:hypothetical protein [Halomonas dongshanensis]|uniref:Uncharacterized protein n=1 Tax=Halomonas dongshanensis TaxID=2890835 RepID=A0ABT2ECS4_9GAMM|nr:hypothetical protein [Halomonas dongshanensis]MCS2609371.1 hypothetical protein [Halomonas dongshanensis]